LPACLKTALSMTCVVFLPLESSAVAFSPFPARAERGASVLALSVPPHPNQDRLSYSPPHNLFFPDDLLLQTFNLWSSAMRCVYYASNLDTSSRKACPVPLVSSRRRFPSLVPTSLLYLSPIRAFLRLLLLIPLHRGRSPRLQ